MIFLLWLFVGVQAFFSELPVNITTIAGGSVTLRCSGEKSHEPIVYSQWKSNTGSMLGYHQEGTLPGHQGRYSYIKPSPNELHLKINHVNLEDDGEYECQMLHPEGGPIRAKSFLNVIVPPQNIHFSTYQPNSSIAVNENTVLNITCIVPNVKPEPEISWYMDGKMLTRETQKTIIAHLNKTVTVFKNLVIQPGKLDHGKSVSCKVFQKETEVKLMSMSKLNVLFPPSDPVVEILSSRKLLRADDEVSLSCTVKGGNPPPDVHWYYQNRKIESNSVLNANTEVISNIYSFVLTKNDNLAQYECRANNSHTKTPLVKHVRLEVKYPTSTLELFGKSKVRIGDIISIQCKSSPSNPASQITWKMNGKSNSQKTQQEVSVGNGFISISNFSFSSNELPVETHQVNVECVASNSEGSTTVEHKIKIIAPPQTPVITGLDDDHFFEGDIVNVSCESRGGQPLAELTWHRGNEEIDGAQNKIAGSSSYSTVSIRLDRSMHNQILRCSASNEALDDPLTATRLISVHYPPQRLVVRPIRNGNQYFQIGKTSRLVCSSLSSNPPAHISWKFPWTNGSDDIQSGDISLNETAKDQSFNVENVISFVPSEAHDGSTVYCFANHPGWKRSVNTSFSLNITYPPKMLVDDPITVTISEGDYFKENITVRSNPPLSSWNWRKNEISFNHTIGRVIARETVLSGKQVTSSDSGIYTLTATNAVGSTNITIKLTVEYSAKITSISGPVIATEGDTVFLECEAKGEPIKNKMVTWYRNKELLPTEYRGNKKGILRLNISSSQAGEYICNADNGKGVPDVKKTFILVNSAPRVLHDPRFMKTAGALGGVAKAICNVHAVPTVDFVWEKDGQFIKANNSKYSIAITQMDHSTYTSTLWIKNIVPDDYMNQVRCIAKNSFGSDSLKIPVIPPTNPEEPRNLSMTNATMNTISISWEPRFDGGSDQLFELKYKNRNSDFVHLVNTTHLNLRISGLEVASSYDFQVRSINARGFSSPFTEPVNFETLNKDGVSVTTIQNNKKRWKLHIPLLLISLIIFMLITVIFCCFSCNRDKKRKLREKTELVRTRGNEDIRQVQMYGTMLGNDHMLPRDVDERLEMSEDEHSVKTIIEVSPNGYMQPIEPIIYESSGLLEYEFQPRSYHTGKHLSPIHNITYANTSYPEPPQISFYSNDSHHQEIEKMSTRRHLSTFINPNVGVRAGPISYSQLDGDLV